MSQDITIIGSFRVKPDSRDAFDTLVQELEAHVEINNLELDEDDMVHIHIDDNTGTHSACECEELLATFIADHSVLGAATLQTGPDSQTSGTYGAYNFDDPNDITRRLAQRDYYTKMRDHWQKLLDILETP